jgi:hypothetical protein
MNRGRSWLAIMTTRNDRTRRAARRARRHEQREVQERAAQEQQKNPTLVNRSRLFQIFGNLSFRSHERGRTRLFESFVIGPCISASTPAELDAKMNDLYVAAVLGQPEN